MFCFCCFFVMQFQRVQAKPELIIGKMKGKKM